MAIPILFLLISIFSIQFGASLAKGLFASLTAEGTAALRLAIAAIILCSVFRPWKRRLSGKEWRAIVVYGSALGAMNTLFYLALHRIPLGVTVALEFLGPLTVALLTSRKFTDILWAILAAGGILLITAPMGFAEPLNFEGVLFALGAGVGWGLYILFGKRAGVSVESGTAASLGMLAGAVVTLPWSFNKVGIFLADEKLIFPLVGVAIFSSAIPYSLEMFVLKKIPVPVFGILMSLEPAAGALSGLLFLGERLAVMQWVGIGCVALASAGCSALQIRSQS